MAVVGADREPSPSSCTTCRLNSFDCPGHFGHIELPSPVFHPLYMTQAFQLLRGTCTYCHHFLTSQVSVRVHCCYGLQRNRSFATPHRFSNTSPS